MDYDDNFYMSGISKIEGGRDENTPSQNTSNNSSSTTQPSLEELTELVLKRLGQVYRPSYKQQGYVPQAQQGPYLCGACGGLHRIYQCTYVTNTGSTPQKKWCQMCRWNYTHVTQDCLHIAQMAKEREQTQYQPMPS